ncbi:nuclear transport factor 2 family protein [Paenibacillus sp. SAF-054]|uniref:nuclear transport factor 2 family protein n=1 Tax=unclassified Paenibacillus TaxID=185978 RepID=UPI003F80F833
MLTEQQIKSAMQSYMDCFNQDDLEGVLSLFAEEASIEDPVGTAPIRGKAAIAEFYGRVVNGKTRIRRDEPIRGSHGNSGAMAIRIESQTADAIMLFHVIEVMTFDEEGHITSMKAYWGQSDMDQK